MELEIRIRQTKAAQAAFFHAQKAEKTMIELYGRNKNGVSKCEAPALRGKSFRRQISMLKTKNLARIDLSR